MTDERLVDTDRLLDHLRDYDMTEPVYGMTPYRGDRVPRAIDGIEASRRVAWAKFYEQVNATQQAQHNNDVLRDRITVLLQLLFELTEAVLTKHTFEAFAVAYRVQQTIDEFGAR